MSRLVQVTYVLPEAGQMQLGLWLLPHTSDEDSASPLPSASSAKGSTQGSPSPKSPQGSVARDSNGELVGGRKWTVLVRPCLAGDLPPAELSAEMDNYARNQLAQSTEAQGDGVEFALAGEVSNFLVCTPSRMAPLSPTRAGKPEMRAWTEAEMRAIQEMRLTVGGTLAPVGVGTSHHPDAGLGSPADFNLVQLVDRGDGSFCVSYSVPTSGLLSLDVQIAGGGPIAGSPFKVRVAAGPLDPSKCTAAGAGLSECEVGVRASFHIVSRDKLGNPRLRDNDHCRVGMQQHPRKLDAIPPVPEGFQISITSPEDKTHRAADSQIECIEGENGGCTVTYLLLQHGEFLLHVCSNNLPISGSPFRLHCQAGPMVPSSSSLLELGCTPILGGGSTPAYCFRQW